MTVQLNVVPVTVPERAMFVASSEHMVSVVGVAVTSGIGLTVMLILSDAVNPFPSVTITV